MNVWVKWRTNCFNSFRL